ncbi:MAG TPA: DUF4397 domain-containing protein [Candidatus Cybelea sp.]|jgi:hypothetical protein|nr:DUF4397 domain-containing protein [Candidatus Cybelea sp.]
MTFRSRIFPGWLALVLAACGGNSSSSSSGMPPAASSTVRVRFAEAAPELETIINGVPASIGSAYLQVNGETVSSQFNYGTITPFLNMTPGTKSMTALNILGYRVGPFKSAPLTGGKDYTLALVGSYPHYRVLSFVEPSGSKAGAQLSLYEASPAVPEADFGSFDAASQTNFKRLGSATLGNVATVSLGAHVANFGAYAGKGTTPFLCGSVTCGELTPASVDSFDKRNELPFHNASRLSLFLFDPDENNASGPTGPVFGSLDR